MKKHWIVKYQILSITLLLVLGGCGPKTSPELSETVPKKSDLLLVSTTSTQDSGLLDLLVPEFEKKTGYNVKTIAVGTGAGLAMGEKGEVDVLLTHSPSAEEKLVNNQDVINYHLVMYNDFVFVGPTLDPAKIKGTNSAIGALKKIYEQNSLFISRGDDSGTHKKEKTLWEEAKIEPTGKWYQESGSGQGQTLYIASQKGGYALTDRGTFLSLQKDLNLDVLVEGDQSLLNVYHVMQVNPDKLPKVNQEGARTFIEFIIDPKTQKQIEEFGKDKFGQSLFYPAAGKEGESLDQ
jgi:tungstate transport system substrate-binding protein